MAFVVKRAKLNNGDEMKDEKELNEILEQESKDHHRVVKILNEGKAANVKLFILSLAASDVSIESQVFLGKTLKNLDRNTIENIMDEKIDEMRVVNKIMADHAKMLNETYQKIVDEYKTVAESDDLVGKYQAFIDIHYKKHEQAREELAQLKRPLEKLIGELGAQGLLWQSLFAAFEHKTHRFILDQEKFNWSRGRMALQELITQAAD